MSYQLDRNRKEALRRLLLLARDEDPGTIRCLERLGVEPGWRCLEVGAGAGTIAEWLAAKVGPEGSVIATDLDTTLLEPLAGPSLEILEHDIVNDALESESFDLIHARQVLMHLPERTAVLGKLAEALRPGGWLLIEDSDASTDGPDPTAQLEMQALYKKVVREIYDFVVDKGVDPRFGGKIFGLLRRLGFESLEAEGRLRVYRGDPDEDASSHVPAFVELRDLILERGSVTEEEFDDFLELTRDPDFSWREGLTIAAWGRKPG